MKKLLPILILLLLVLSSCRISYTFHSAAINYALTPTIVIRPFPNQAPDVYAPLEPRFNEALMDIFTRRTRLQIFTNHSEHMSLEGEIIGWQLTPLAVREDMLADEARLTMTVRIRFNNYMTEESITETFSANRVFSASLMLNQVAGPLAEEMTSEIVDQIFNATMANW